MIPSTTRSRLRSVSLAVALLAGLCTGTATVRAAQPAADQGATLNFVNADIESVIRALGKVTGHNFVVDPRVKGKLNIVSEKPVPQAVFHDIVISALRLQGFTAVDKNGYTLILPEGEARQFGGKAVGQPASGERLATRVFPLSYEQPAAVLQAVRPLVSNNNAAAAQATGGSIVVTDYADNLARIAAVVEAIDQPQADEPVLIPLEHASASDVADTLTKLMGSANTAGTSTGNTLAPVTVVADARSNRLIVRTASPARLKRVRALALSLDTPGLPGGQIHVVTLKNAEAAKVARTLKGLLGGDVVADATARPAAVQGAAPAGTAGTAGLVVAKLPGGGMLEADPTTNSLIIAAPDALYRNLRAVIERLDVRRPQVYVEALIAEISLQNLAEFGFQWQALSSLNKNGTGVLGGTNFGTSASGNNIIGATTNPLGVGPGLNLGVSRGTVTYNGQTILNLGMLAHALQNDSKNHILSEPNLITLDNEEAKIVMGENVPFITGQYAQTGNTTTPTPFQTIERKDVGLTLKVRPLITESGAVQLQIYQEVSAVEPATLTNQAGPSTTKRSVESTVLVDDGQVVALGGLLQDEVDNGVSKVPLLGDAPLLGQFFRYETRQRTRRSLTIFLRPVILRDSIGAARLSDASYRAMQAAGRTSALSGNVVLPDMPVPVLPDLPSRQPAPAK